MKVELDREALIALVCVQVPNYSIFEHPLVKKCGSYCGGFVEKWSWKGYELEELSKQELYELYMLCKNSFEK